ncbi:unnamed protein product [Fusarium graminearum]|uniref:Chromosome 1, complete genome n=2 Tax=Gibberella zeae TaxID=5518 RepID=A0A0E0RL94_GIBZE|nr:hypothetical protein FG05_30022 [Fusarium graminearum]CAF3499528.1 unnamed protein product [Fusarium graminearum]CAF3572063.1 unnamed protein product [Fusarium graminearum]CAG1988076.1 unnamed protein product [Fusarium graminearum]CAG1990958.1 unnamed protein product [Fusarium graminearum]
MPSDLGQDQWRCDEWVYDRRQQVVPCNTIHSMASKYCRRCDKPRGAGAKALKNGVEIGMLMSVQLGEEDWALTPATSERGTHGHI